MEVVEVRNTQAGTAAASRGTLHITPFGVGVFTQVQSEGCTIGREFGLFWRFESQGEPQQIAIKR